MQALFLLVLSQEHMKIIGNITATAFGDRVDVSSKTHLQGD